MTNGQRLKPTRVQRDRPKTRASARTGRRRSDGRTHGRGRHRVECDGRYRSGDRSSTKDRTLETAGSRTTIGRPDSGRVHGGTLLAPAVIAVVYALVDVLSSGAAFDVTAGGLTAVISLAALGAFLLVAGFGTARLHADAERIAAGSRAWNPSSSRYVAGGGAVLSIAWLVRQMVLEAGSVSPLSITGVAVTSLALSSVVADPVYLLRRSRLSAGARGQSNEPP